MDYAKVTRELFKALRADLTQSELSLELGYNFNVVSKWEVGATHPKWTDFVKLVDHQQVDIRKPLEQLAGFGGDPNESALICEILMKPHNQNAALEKLKITRSTFNRWLRCDAVPPAHQMFALLDYNHVLVQFLSCLVDPAAMPSLSERAGLDRKAINLFEDFPETPAILCFIETLLSHDRDLEKGQIAELMCLSQEKEEQVIDALIDAGFLFKDDGGRYRLLEVNLNTGFTSARTYEQEKKVKLFWIQFARKLLEKATFDHRRCGASYRLFSTTKRKEQLLKKEAGLFLKKVVQILDEPDEVDEKDQVVGLLNLQIAQLFKI